MRKFLDKIKPHFDKGGKLHKLEALYEMIDTILYTPSDVTRRASHIRDGIDLKRIMTMVIIALVPATIMACYNTGLQANLALQELGKTPEGWRASIMALLGRGFNPSSIKDDFVYGMLYFVPVYLVSLFAGGVWETIFAIIRKHEINEGFLVTSLLFPLILPPTIPLWQVAIGISFAVVIGKEVFGGTGMNVFNPALVGRAFLFFNFPAQMSGDSVWVAVDGYTHTTPLAAAAGYTNASSGIFDALHVNWLDAFWGFIPGSMGETSTFAILLGAFFLIITGIGSWRIMASVTASMFILTTLFNAAMNSSSNSMFLVTPLWHLVLGGFAFGTVFMATDPVSSAMTNAGKYIYGSLIGIMVVLIRVVNPAFPEGMMLAILFSNAFAPLIDHFVVRKNINRRKLRNAVR
ncbi:MAG: NADH:ubiquinone reductase (Na(+)-transporting) subunit B [Spirochaetia bacterium]|nr:NADH:ubiquinone reductase (Na(+)-transporting) subunit B [Spirochaetia bacterium]